MDSTNNNNNNQLIFVSELKELGNELSAMKKRVDQLEKSHEKQQEKLNILESENHALKTELNHLNGIKTVGSLLKRKRTEKKDQDTDEEIESKPPVSVSAGKKKTKTNNNNNDDDDDAVVIPERDNGDSFDSLSDDLLHKIVEFDGNCYSKFGSINKRCKNIYDVEEYKLKKQTCLYGYGTLDMMLERYLQKRREGSLSITVKCHITEAVVKYNRLDAIEWIVQLGDNDSFKMVCRSAARYGKINILTRVFLKLNLATLDELLNDTSMCYNAAYDGHLETLKWLRKYGAEWDGTAFIEARDRGYEEIVDYLCLGGCPEDGDY